MGVIQLSVLRILLGGAVECRKVAAWRDAIDHRQRAANVGVNVIQRIAPIENVAGVEDVIHAPIERVALLCFAIGAVVVVGLARKIGRGI